jgi:hypothetical protein
LSIELAFRLLVSAFHLGFIHNPNLLARLSCVSDAGLPVVLRRCDVLRELFGRYTFRTQVVIVLVLVLLLFPTFLFLRRPALVLLLLRQPVLDVIFDLMKHIGVGLHAVLLVVDIVLLGLTGPGALADHVEVCIGGLMELLVLLE